ncbi:MAG: hypothetical protein ACKO32_14215 [Planctomycetia bacterium]
MNKFLALCLLPLTLAFLSPLDTVRFGPKSGSEVKKSMTIGLELNIEEFDIVVDGEELPRDALGEALDQAFVMEVVQTVTDKYIKVKEDQVEELIRSYDSMQVTMEMGEEVNEETGTEGLVGKQVRFARNEKTGAFDKEWFECEGEEEMLKGLSEDMDMRRLLPSGSVKPDQEWKLEGKDMGALMWPGVTSANDLDLSAADLDAEQAEIAQMVMDDLSPRFEEALKGMKIGLKYVGTREVEGEELAEIAINIDGTMVMDMGDLIKKVAESQGGGEEMAGADIKLSVQMGMKGEGALLWNNKSGHLHSYNLDATMEFTINGDLDVDAKGESHSASATIKLAGKANWDLSTVK